VIRHERQDRHGALIFFELGELGALGVLMK
jgi:hypothetical protein